jgi:putative CocE/NonD family hydrolase
VSSTRPRELVQAGGSFGLETMLEWIDQVAYQERPGAILRQQQRVRAVRKLHNHLPLGDLDRLATGTPKSYWQAWLADDADFWTRHGYAAGPTQTTASIDLIAGWHDIFLPAQLRDYAALIAAGHQPRLTIGPWRHTDNAAVGMWVRQGLDFLRAHLDGSGPEPATDPVRVFVTGAEQWRDLPRWPPASSPVSWYLQPEGGLCNDLPAEGAPDGYVYNPADPTPNLAGPVGAQGTARVDNRMLEARSDVLTFTGAALERDVEVIGVPAVDLYVASDRQHTDFFARLCEVEPTGRSVNMSDGLLRLSPGVPPTAADGTRRVVFELWPIAHRFKARNRLRLQISSGAHPRYARNTGTGDPLATGTKLVLASQRVFHDPARPSAVILPIQS